MTQSGLTERLLDYLVGGQRSSNDPLQCFAFVALVIGSYLGVQKHPDRTNQPMLPVVRDDDCNAIHLPLVVFDEPSMIFKGRNILPAVKSGSINQQSNLPIPTDDRIDLWSNLAEVVSLQFLRCCDPQYVVRNNIYLDRVSLLRCESDATIGNVHCRRHALDWLTLWVLRAPDLTVWIANRSSGDTVTVIPEDTLRDKEALQ
jgi:hypothetical protein